MTDISGPTAPYRSSHLKAAALSLGFSACGIARAGRVSKEEEERFRQWIAKGHQAEMHYMERYLDQRLDPRLLLPGARTIVSVALNYTPVRNAEGFHLAAYALGADYHDVMRQKLFELARRLGCREQGRDFRVCVDTAPVLERYWAVQAGLGWQGKSQQLIVCETLPACDGIRPLGTMFFLGELLLTGEADSYDHPLESRCGNCRRCIDACPMGALPASALPGDFDAERCLSYQTIEHRGPLSKDAASKVGTCIYGCDICQQVCPMNRHARPTTLPELQPRDGLLDMTDSQWTHLSIEQYRTLFKGSAVKRAKYEGLLRNIRAAARLDVPRQDDDNTVTCTDNDNPG